ncbi:MAG: glycosyltransferase family 4 protein [Candidatus Thorarchaeota archaeon]
MVICIDSRKPGTRGIYTYINNLLKKIIEIDNENKYLILTDINHPSWNLKNVEEIPVPSLNPIYWFFWSNTVLPKIIKDKKVDIYHSLKHITAFLIKAKKIVTIHGIHSHYFSPQYYKWYDTLYWKMMLKLAEKSYDKILTVSENEKNFFVNNLKYSESKFSITYLGVDEKFKIIDNKSKLIEIKNKYNLPDKFFFFAGQIDPIKNIKNMIMAFYSATLNKETDFKLVLAGNDKNKFADKMKFLVKELKIENEVIFLGYISDDLKYIYNLAEAYLFLSKSECFGLAALEAMACGLPIIASNIPEMKELVSEAGILVDPDKVSKISEAIEKILSDADLRLYMGQKSLKRAEIFSWENCAKKTLGIYEELFI